MKTILSCERVFELLTRGPFPSGELSDVQVAEHLELCHECRELAEALRPATDVLHESLLAADRVGLPCYDPSNDSADSLAREAVGVPGETSAVNRIMEQVRRADVRNITLHDTDIEKRPQRLTGYFPVISLVATLAAVLIVATFLPRYGGSGASAAIPKTDEEKRDYLLGLGVAEFCIQSTALANLKVPSVTPHGDDADCCTDCHSAANSKALPVTPHKDDAGCFTDFHRAAKSNAPMSKQQLEALANSCLACHVATPPPSIASTFDSLVDSLFKAR